MSEPERLQKVLARIGVGSRRASEEIIDAGRVTVNGVVATLGQRVDEENDSVAVDGVVMSVQHGLITYLLNKPAGVVSTASDPEGRPIVIDLVPKEPRVFPVGRLDYETEGLLLLTNDGDLTHRLTHPSFGVEKEYLAEVEGRPTRAAIRALREGIELEDGLTAPAKSAAFGESGIKLTIHEGRNRQVRRMCDAVGFPVRRLVRIRIGPIVDTTLKAGEWRKLERDELLALRRAVGLASDEPPPVG